MLFLLYLTINLWIILITVTRPSTIINNKYNANGMLIIFILFISLQIGSLEINEIPDMRGYLYWFRSFVDISLVDALKISKFEPVFVILHWALAQISASEVFFKISIWLCFSLLFILFLKNILNYWQTLIVFTSYSFYFIFFGYAVNVIRQGLAICCLLIAISILLKGKINSNKIFYLCIFLAPLFHLSSLPFSIVLLILRKIEVPLKVSFLIWSIASLLFVTGYNSSLFGWIVSYFSYSNYISVESIKLYEGGINRTGFLIYSIIWICFGLIIRKYLLVKDNFLLLLNIYLLYNAIFLLFGFSAFSDRTAAYSWFLVPLMIWMALFQHNVISRKFQNIIYVFTISIFFWLGYYSGNIQFILGLN